MIKNSRREKMGKKYLDTKEGSLEQSVLGVWQTAIDEGEARMDGRTKQYKEHRAKLEAARTRREEKKMDKVDKKALKKDFDDRKDKDIDNDGDVDDSDEYLHNRRKTVAKAIKKDKKEEVEESYEIGTDEYRKHTQDVTPGEDGEWVDAVKKKNESMREALAKVWNTTEDKNPFKKEAKKDLTKEVKNGKTMTGKKVASVDINPTIKEKAK